MRARQIAEVVITEAISVVYEFAEAGPTDLIYAGGQLPSV